MRLINVYKSNAFILSGWDVQPIPLINLNLNMIVSILRVISRKKIAAVLEIPANMPLVECYMLFAQASTDKLYIFLTIFFSYISSSLSSLFIFSFYVC